MNNNSKQPFYISPLQGLKSFFIFTQGVALGWYVSPFQGEEGIQKGVKQGVKQGAKQGKKDGQFLVAMNLLKKGFDLEMIKEITELNDKDLKTLISFIGAEKKSLA